MKKFFPLVLLTLLLLVSCGSEEHTCAFSEWHTLEQPTCSSEGRAYRSCSCGKTESKTVPPLSHTLINAEAKPVTCEENGYDAFEYCADCSYTTFKGEIAACHDTVSAEAKSPTCTEVGYEAYEYCTRCENYSTYSQISATGHSFDGLECVRCGEELTLVTTPDTTLPLGEGITASYYVTDGGMSLLDITGNGTIPDFEVSPFSDLLPTHLRIGDGITAIGKNAFSGMATLVSVTVGSSVTDIGDGAFKDCYRITEVVNRSTLPIARDSVHGEIGLYASYVTTSVETRIKFIGDFVFYVNNGNYTLVSYLGTEQNLTLPVISEASTYVVRNYAFYDLDFLLSVEWGANVVYVGTYAFVGCDNLNTV